MKSKKWKEREIPLRKPPRMEGVVQNVGIKPKKKKKKPKIEDDKKEQ